MPRDILEPIDEGSFSIGSVAQRDEWLSLHTISGIPECNENGEPLDEEIFHNYWEEYRIDCSYFLDAVAFDWRTNSNYLRADYGYLLKKSMIKASQHILALYDHLQEAQPAAPLFANYARAALAPTEPCLPAHSTFTERLAHASDQYPLAAAQRDALAHLLHSQQATSSPSMARPAPAKPPCCFPWSPASGQKPPWRKASRRSSLPLPPTIRQ